MNVPFVDLKSQYYSLKKEMDKAIEDVITKSAFIGGEYVDKFEKEFAQLYGVKECISCANGTDSLYILMKMMGIGPGDEVITVANSWISSSETISQTGAKPVFVDIDGVYYSMNTSLLARAITPATKAVIAVHLQGQMCEIDEIRTICDAAGIYLIEDCAQSHFSSYKGVRAGLTGHAASFSFYPGKNLGAYGDAGCIITNDDTLANKCRMYARHGALKKHQHQIEGINSRLDGLQAAVLSVKLPHVLDWTQQRIENARRYSAHLGNIQQVVVPSIRPDSVHSFHLYVIQAENRDGLMAYLKEHGVECAIHYPTPLPLLKAYDYLGHTAADFPVSAALQHKILSLPLYPELTEETIKEVARLIAAFYSGRA